MKLNKVLALALSGVMAVSMLAGCSGNSGNGGQTGEGDVIVTPSTGAAAILNDEQDKVEFTNVNSAELQQAATDLLASDLSTKATLGCLTSSDALYKRLTALGVENLTNTWTTFGDNIDEDETKVVTIVYDMSGAYSMNEVVKQVAKDIENAADVRDKVVMDSGNGIVRTYSYTGTVSTVTATSIDGTQSANYVMITVTESVDVQEAV